MQQGFPGQHTTTTTVNVGTTAVNPTIRLDTSYFKTLPGILKVVQVVLNLLGFICIISTVLRYNSREQWFNTVAMGGFWFTGIILCFYVFHIIEKFHKIPWLKIELVFCLIWTACNLLAASLVAGDARIDDALAAAAVFGFLAMVAYGIDAWLKFMAIKRGDIAQGERQVNQSGTTTIPAY
ncbi:uncharacterized protein LOC105689080 [Athalia rosae]|uniref:uncharacterized protein LOC105689080 n=1 Tax=Athalia rosae TaxID=37344 RepID=UPI000626688D|nr:uncharacterized protein LOC105689080 [Athalia rosae]XP_020709783.1 uncharacterized protein LOC105689080 [Athalia rosae]XP_048505641.1 uncharacterized protein LOC105689080 [Athalia rosae]